MHYRLAACSLMACLVAMPVAAQRVSQMPSLSEPPMVAPRAPVVWREGIAAVVNDSIVTISDVRDRLLLALLSSGMPNTQEMRERLFPQVFRSLVDEQLQLQEGKKYDISSSDAEIDQALQNIAAENKIPGGDMAAFLRSQGASVASLREQVRANLVWNKVVMRTIRPRIDIGDEEIDALLQKMRTDAGKQEYLVSEVFLSVDRPEDEAEVKALAEKLAEQIKDGAVFGAIARQFSQGTGAGTGGDMGWIQASSLGAEVGRALQSMEVGQTVGPVRSGNGYHILGLRDKRVVSLGEIKDLSVRLAQVFRPFSSYQDKETLLREAAEIRQKIASCDDTAQSLLSSFPEWKWQDLGEIKADTAPDWLAKKMANLGVGEGSEPFETDRGVMVLFVCDRVMPEQIDRNALRSTIGTEKLELMARRAMRDMRRNAYLDIRLKALP